MPDETKVTIEEILGEKKSVFLRSLAQKLKLSMGNSSEPFNLKLRARLHED